MTARQAHRTGKVFSFPTNEPEFSSALRAGFDLNKPITTIGGDDVKIVAIDDGHPHPIIGEVLDFNANVMWLSRWATDGKYDGTPEAQEQHSLGRNVDRRKPVPRQDSAVGRAATPDIKVGPWGACPADLPASMAREDVRPVVLPHGRPLVEGIRPHGKSILPLILAMCDDRTLGSFARFGSPFHFPGKLPTFREFVTSGRQSGKTEALQTAEFDKAFVEATKDFKRADGILDSTHRAIDKLCGVGQPDKDARKLTFDGVSREELGEEGMQGLLRIIATHPGADKFVVSNRVRGA